MEKGSLYVTDWGKATISEIDTSTGKLELLASGVAKPTGIVRPSLNPKTQCECIYSNEILGVSLSFQKNWYANLAIANTHGVRVAL